MKIAINALGPSKIKAGIGNYLTNLVEKLADIDNKNKYIIFVSNSNRNFFEVNKANFFIKDIGFWAKTRFFRIFWEQLILPFLLLEYKIDLLFSPGFVCPLIKTAKYVTTIHDMTFFSHPEVHTFFKRYYFPFMIKKSVRNSDLIISVSENTKREIIKYIDIKPEKIRVTLLAANIFPIEKIKNEKDFLRDKYRIDTNFLLFVGMIEPRKNIELIIASLEKIDDENIKLVIVGKKGWMFENLYREISRRKLEKRIIFAGYVPDEELVYFYRNAEIFVYPSYYEGFGIPVLEAMKSGCPVITSNISSLPEVAGNAAILIDPNREEELTIAINLILIDKTVRENMIKKGFDNSAEFDWEKTAERSLEIFKNVVAEKF